MFEEIEQANDGREMILAPQNHPTVDISFVWDTTQSDEIGGVVSMASDAE